MIRKYGLLFGTLLLAAMALSAGVWLHNHFEKKPVAAPQLISGSVLPTPKPLTDFHLQFSNGTAFTPENLKGQWHLLFFGFTNCPWLCPTTLATLNQVDHKLREAHQASPQVIFISVDPERDTPAKIKTYVNSFNQNFSGATGSDAELDKLTSQVSVLYMKVKANTDNKDYTIDHSGAILVINPQAELYAIFSTPHEVAKLVQDIKVIMSQIKAN